MQPVGTRDRSGTVKLQRSSWSTAGCRPVDAADAWVTETAAQYATAPPIDLDEQLATKRNSVAQMLQLRQHQFSIGSSEPAGAASRFTSVSGDIGNFSPAHADAARLVTAPPQNKRMERQIGRAHV